MPGTSSHSGAEQALVSKQIEPQNQDALAKRFRDARFMSERIAKPLSAEDCAIQSMPDVSPIRWHLAHTTWFFETFILKSSEDYQPFDSSFEYLFNSYYNSVGSQFPRDKRGLISRPGLSRTLEYRQHVDQAIIDRLHSNSIPHETLAVIELGINHEQQHQELMLTDIKHILACNPLFPAYAISPGLVSEDFESKAAAPASPVRFNRFEEGVREVGFQEEGFQETSSFKSSDGSHTFCFDNELPRHKQYIHAFQIADRCVTNGEYLEFINSGGYSQPEHWLSMGWAAVEANGWNAPLYWIPSKDDAQGTGWREFTLGGLHQLDLAAPVCHVSYFEADAYARWAGYRLPTEFEWENASSHGSGNCFADRLLDQAAVIHPRNHLGQASPAGKTSNSADRPVELPIDNSRPLKEMFGGVWEWTASQYSPYPGFAARPGALGEYNGKFMCNQFVLRGGSCATSSDHFRPTYRNFFPPEARWQFTGIRLAK